MTLNVLLPDGAKIRLRRHGDPDGARLLISHGNGFAIDGYFPYWRLLAATFDLVVFDFRNHGENAPSAATRHNYPQFTLDLECVLQAVKRELGDKPTVGIFHSMSARAAMKHALEIGWHWDALILFDPPNMPPQGHPAYPAMERLERRLADWARQRRRHFAAIGELASEYSQSPATSRWVEGAHELMAKAVLRKEPGADGYELVCDPHNEAAIYEQAFTLNLWPQARQFGGPVKLIGCDPSLKGFSATGVANQALGREGGYDYACVEGAGHMLQIERPEECLRLTTEFLKAKGLVV